MTINRIINSGLIIWLALYFSVQLSAQLQPVYQLNFNNCDGTDAIGNLDNEITSPTVDCDCGVEQDAVYLNEEADSIFLDDGVKALLSKDFTFSMYFWAEPAPQVYSMFNVQRFCNKDSIFNIKYLPSIQEVNVEVAQNFGSGAFLFGKVNPDRCWHHLVLVRNGLDYSLTVDGVFAETKSSPMDVVMGERHKVRIGSSPCLNTLESFMRGRVDQLKIFDRVLTLDEIQSLDERPNQILSQDTTIFAGSSFPILTGPTCTSNFDWIPSTGLDDPNLLNPDAGPTETTQYFLNLDYGTCRAQDSIRISVIDEDAIDCSQLLMPNIFTPNGDKINDEFAISNDFIIEDLNYFEIYDRWGSKVFETNVKQEGWDGSMNGQTQPPAMYVYKIEYTCQNETFKKLGNFSLLK